MSQLPLLLFFFAVVSASITSVFFFSLLLLTLWSALCVVPIDGCSLTIITVGDRESLISKLKRICVCVCVFRMLFVLHGWADQLMEWITPAGVPGVGLPAHIYGRESE